MMSRDIAVRRSRIIALMGVVVGGGDGGVVEVG